MDQFSFTEHYKVGSISKSLWLKCFVYVKGETIRFLNYIFPLRKGEDAEARNCKREGAIEHVISLFRLRSFASFTLVVFFNSLLLSVRMNYLFCSKLFQACFSVFYSSFFPVNISAQKSWNSHGPISPCILISTIRSSASGYISPVCIDSYYFSSEMIFRELSRFLERVEIHKKGK